MGFMPVAPRAQGAELVRDWKLPLSNLSVHIINYMYLKCSEFYLLQIVVSLTVHYRLPSLRQSQSIDLQHHLNTPYHLYLAAPGWLSRQASTRTATIRTTTTGQLYCHHVLGLLV